MNTINKNFKCAKSKYYVIILLSWLSYVLSYLGRVNYGACMLEIVNQTGIARGTAGLVSSVFSFCYALGQLTAVTVLKKKNPVYIIAVELIIASGINIAFPFCVGNIALMLIMWALNGAVQSVLVCTLTRIFVENMEEPYVSEGAVSLQTVGATGGTLNYLLIWHFLKYQNWQWEFYTMGITLCAFFVIWTAVMPFLTKETQKRSETKDKKPQNSKISLKKNGLIFAVTGCLAIGFLREGTALWIPSYIHDTFNFSTADSTVIVIAVPLLQIFGAFFAGAAARRKSSNIHFLCAMTFCVSAVSMIMLLTLGRFSVICAIAMFTLNSILMTASLTLYQSLYPIRMFRGFNTAFIVGILNFCFHGGGFIGEAGIGAVSEAFGWNSVFGLLLAVALISAVNSVIGGMKNVKNSI